MIKSIKDLEELLMRVSWGQNSTNSSYGIYLHQDSKSELCKSMKEWKTLCVISVGSIDNPNNVTSISMGGYSFLVFTIPDDQMEHVGEILLTKTTEE